MEAERHAITQLSPKVLLYKITAGKKKITCSKKESSQNTETRLR